MSALAFVVRTVGVDLEDTPEGLYRMDTLRRDADAGTLALAREFGTGLIELDELTQRVDDAVARVVLGVPSDGSR